MTKILKHRTHYFFPCPALVRLSHSKGDDYMINFARSLLALQIHDEWDMRIVKQNLHDL